jgi:hypothetical protein
MASSTGAREISGKTRQEKTTNLALSNCEANAATLDATHQLAGNDGLIIVIARLGSGEWNRKVTQRRLQTVKAYLTKTPWERPAETVILAEGERVRGYGRIELYVGDKRIDVLAVGRNRPFLTSSCAK